MVMVRQLRSKSMTWKEIFTFAHLKSPKSKHVLLLFIYNTLTVEASEMLSQQKMLIDYKKNVSITEER